MEKRAVYNNVRSILGSIVATSGGASFYHYVHTSPVVAEAIADACSGFAEVTVTWDEHGDDSRAGKMTLHVRPKL